MNVKFPLEVLTTIIITVLLVLIANPFNFWMPSMMHMLVLALFTVTLGAFATLMWREHAHDEREQTHRNSAGRAGFLAAAAVLTIGIVVQSTMHTLDPWLVYTLGAMIIAKTGAFIYSRAKQ